MIIGRSAHPNFLVSSLKAGSLLPWTLPPYGYRTDPDRPRDPRSVRIDEAQGAITQEIFALYLQTGVSLYSLALELHACSITTPRGKKLWNLGTLRGILSNPAYTGLVYARAQKPQTCGQSPVAVAPRRADQVVLY